MSIVPGFACEALELEASSKDVYRAGNGPAVIVMSEIPGITPAVARFAQRIADAGFTAFMPQLFGEPMRPLSRSYANRVIGHHANPSGPKIPHSVLTNHLIDAAGEPTRAALDRTIAFLREQLQQSQ